MVWDIPMCVSERPDVHVNIQMIPGSVSGQQPGSWHGHKLFTGWRFLHLIMYGRRNQQNRQGCPSLFYMEKRKRSDFLNKVTQNLGPCRQHVCCTAALFVLPSDNDGTIDIQDLPDPILSDACISLSELCHLIIFQRYDHIACTIDKAPFPF